MNFKKKILVFMSGFALALIVVMTLITLDGLTLLPKFRLDQLKAYEADYGKVDDLKQEILDRYYLDVDQETLDEGMIYGMFEAVGDKYTSYMNVDEFKAYNDSTRGNYVGIGILSNTAEEQIEILRVYKNSPAEKAGILAGDLVIDVDGLDIEDHGFRALIDKMLGEAGQSVLVTVKRDQAVVTFDIPRGSVKIPFVDSHIIEDMGYIYIHQFGTDTSKEFDKHLDQLLEAKVEGIVLDLRNNPGGLVTESTKIADRLLAKGLIVYTLDKDKNKKTYHSKKSQETIPMVFLANENSASASEILLAAIKDYKRGPIVGKNTFGKGIVQSVSRYSDESGYKITYSQYFSPNGLEIHKKGVAPDYEVDYEGKINIEAPNLLEDPQLKKAFDLLNEK